MDLKLLLIIETWGGGVNVSVHLPVICLYIIYNTTLRGSVQTNSFNFSLHYIKIALLTLHHLNNFSITLTQKLFLSSTLSDMCIN